MISRNKNNLGRLKTGMSISDVLRIMGIKDMEVNYYERLFVLRQPWKELKVQKQSGEIYRIFFYLTDIGEEQYVINEDEFTPIVVKDHILLGWGHDTLDEVLNKLVVKQNDSTL